MRVDSIASIRMGATLRGRDATRGRLEGSCRLIRIGDISQDGLWQIQDFKRFEPTDPVAGHLFLRAGDILFPNRGTRTTAIVYRQEEPRTLVGAQFFVLTPDPRRIHPEYLAWYLRSDRAAQHFKQRRKGTTVQILQRGDLGELDVPVPPLARQVKIAELGQLATLERNLSERLARLRAQAIHLELIETAGAVAPDTAGESTS